MKIYVRKNSIPKYRSEDQYDEYIIAQKMTHASFFVDDVVVSQDTPVYFGGDIPLINVNKQGYEFDHWTCNGKSYYTGEEFDQFLDNAEFHASFYADDYSVIMYEHGIVNLKYGDYLPSGEFNIIKKEGYDFLGWFDENNCMYIDSKGNGVKRWDKTDNNYVLKPKFQVITYTITYVLNGGENSPENSDHYSKVEDLFLKNPTKLGYKFDGWYVNGVRIDRNHLNGLIGNLVLTAIWKDYEDVISGNQTFTKTYDQSYVVIKVDEFFSGRYNLVFYSSVLKVYIYSLNPYKVYNIDINILNRATPFLLYMKDINIKAPKNTICIRSNNNQELDLYAYGQVTIAGGDGFSNVIHSCISKRDRGTAQRGADGRDGYDGANGCAGIYSYSLFLFGEGNLKIIGGNGEDGTDGYNGGNGQDAYLHPDGNIFSPDKGQNGGRGGDGGCGGRGGDGGYAVFITSKITSTQQLFVYYKGNIMIKGGDGGDGGCGGHGGSGGDGASDNSANPFNGVGDPGDGGDGGNGGRGGDGGHGGSGYNVNYYTGTEGIGGSGACGGRGGGSGSAGGGGDAGTLGGDGHSGSCGYNGSSGNNG